MKQPKIIETKVEKCKRNLHMPLVPYEDDQTRSLVDAALPPEPDDVL